MMIANYHTHTFRCGHAGTDGDESYVKEAIRQGFRILGFSDHTPWPYANGFSHTRVRMLLDQLPEYIASIRALQEKYRGQICIYAGLECEYFPAYMQWLKSIKDHFDFLILGSHWAPSDEHGELYYSRATCQEEVAEYARYTLSGMETGFFRYLAHPDHVFSDYPEFDNACIDASYALCHKAKQLDMPLEYNISGYIKRDTGKQKGLGFPCAAFWEIAAETGCTAILGIDAHSPEQLKAKAYLQEAQDTLVQLGIACMETLPGLE